MVGRSGLMFGYDKKKQTCGVRVFNVISKMQYSVCENGPFQE